MYSTLPEYHSDLNKVSALLALTGSVKDFAGIGDSEVAEEDVFFSHAAALHEISKVNRANLVVLNGTLLLYVSGKFENFVRLTFEELCNNIADKAEKYSYLPKEMRENHVRLTAEVIANPRKYGHGDLGVRSFIKVLSDNLADDVELESINTNCLSITSENMRPKIISDLFKRVGINNIWEKISQQAKLQLFLETHDPAKAKKDAEAYLNKLMDVRNSIAHPASSFSWPDSEYVGKSIEFLKVLGEVLAESLAVIELDLSKRIEEAKANKARQ
ncbi:HEPN domain-containing protein [Gallaecimonas sp. GXIMD4217]|uniref:HEPN domain-containing protein n=1 Tax=Gallaecimonas sp. GXIMD4217 TaxID=3131927 RepID=UPI00311B3CBE